MPGPAPTLTPVKVATASTVQRNLPVQWTGGVQHNGNNPEVIDQMGRSYSSRAVAPNGVGFENGAQHIFASGKNMTGQPMAQTVVLSNPGNEPLRLRVNMTMTDPKGQTREPQEVTVPPRSSVQVPVATAKDKGFIAFNATVTPVDDASKKGKINVDVVAHPPGSKASPEAKLIPTEGERGYRVPPNRLTENPHYIQETRAVMGAAGVSGAKTMSQDQVVAWARQQAADGAAGKPTQFDPNVNRGIQGRVNGLVRNNAGTVNTDPLNVSQPGSSNTVRIRPNANPPTMVGSRPGSSARDVGAYGKRITTTVPLRNDSDQPVQVRVRLATPPPGQDGSQIPGHQSYNGPVIVSATGGQVSDVRGKVQLGQPGGSGKHQGSAQIAVVTIPARSSVNLRVGLDTHANSQFPLDLTVER